MTGTVSTGTVTISGLVNQLGITSVQPYRSFTVQQTG